MAEAEEHGWTFLLSSYWKGRCSCPEKHYKTVVQTPSGSKYAKNLAHWFRRQSCW